MGRLVRGQLARHEAQLHERAHAVFEQSVVDLVHISEVVNGAALRVFVVHAVLVVEDGVEANVSEAGNLPGFPKIAAIALAQRKIGASRAEHLLPKMRERPARSRGIHDNRVRRETAGCNEYRRGKEFGKSHLAIRILCLSSIGSTDARAGSGWNPIRSSAGRISGFAMNTFQSSPERWFSIIATIGAWSSARYRRANQFSCKLKASRKPYTPHRRLPNSR